MFAKIKLYIAIGIASIIIGLLVFIGIQYIRIESLKNNVEKIKIKNAVLNKDNLFSEKKVEIRSDFTNSDAAIDAITNIIIFDGQKQIAVDKIIEDFYK